MTTTHTLDVPGAHLHYEIRGTGPLLLVMGSPMAARFFAHELRGTTRYTPDITALATARVVVGIGADSGGLLTHTTSATLAERLGVTPVEFPGDHGGFLGHPEAFADTLHAVLSSTERAG